MKNLLKTTSFALLSVLSLHTHHAKGMEVGKDQPQHQHYHITRGFMEESIDAFAISETFGSLDIKEYFNPKRFLGIEEIDLSTLQPVNVGIVDTVFDFHCPSLHDALSESYKIEYDNYTPSQVAERRKMISNLPSPDHGTEVANIIGGKNGLAPNAVLKPIRGRIPSVEKQIRAAVDSGAKFINMSLGFDNDDMSNPMPKKVKSALKYARDNGVGIIMSAGNEGRALHTTRYGQSFAKLAKKLQGNLLIVGNTQYTPKGKENVFENISPSSNTAGKEQKYFVCAPGTNFKTYGINEKPDWNATGTSLSAPVVTAMAAIINGAYPTLSSAEVLKVIRKSARRHFLHDHAQKLDRNIYGWGVVDLKAALEMAKQRVEGKKSEAINSPKTQIPGEKGEPRNILKEASKSIPLKRRAPLKQSR